jgi:ABC-type multidrug transport system ATPase subunit
MFAIEIESLDFAYQKNQPILKNLSLKVPNGSIYGFIGPNGAGKSTTMRLIAGIYPDDSKKVRVFGKSIAEQVPFVFHKIGALVESPTLYLHLSGEDNLRYIATIRNIGFDNIPKILELVDLQHAKNNKVKKYSLGMKQRLAIAMALLHEPELLLLDEPVNGLDPTGMIEIRELLVRINQEKGTTIFISSHLLGEIEKMCTHVGIIHKGEIKFEGNIKELGTNFAGCKLEIETQITEQQSIWIKENYTVVESKNANFLEVELSGKEEIPTLVRNFTLQDIPIYGIKNNGGLEEWFLNITKK